MDILNTLAELAGARGLIDLKTNQPLFAVVTPRTSSLYNELETLAPQHLFADLQSAINALPDGSTYASYTTQNPSTIYVAPGVYTSTVKIVVPDTQSGLKIYFDKGAEITTATALSAGDGLLEIEGRNVQVIGGTLSNSQATQTGSALIIGGSTATEGDGKGVVINGLEILGFTTATDWVKPLVVRGAQNVTIKNSVIYGSTATTKIISVEAGNSRNSTNLKLVNVIAKAITDSGNTCVPLSIDASQTGGQIIGGEYTTDGSGKAIIITADDWTLGGAGLAGSTGAITSGGTVDLVTATKIRIGQFYVKDLDDTTTAPSLLTQANV